jgi:hypothetical protein
MPPKKKLSKKERAALEAQEAEAKRLEAERERLRELEEERERQIVEREESRKRQMQEFIENRLRKIQLRDSSSFFEGIVLKSTHADKYSPHKFPQKFIISSLRFTARRSNSLNGTSLCVAMACQTLAYPLT